MNNSFFARFLNALMKPYNALNIGFGIVFEALLHNTSLSLYPIAISSAILLSSLIYDLFIKNNNSNFSKDHEYYAIEELINKKNDNINSILLKILNALSRLKSLDTVKYSNITNFMMDIMEFEKIVPELVKKYRSSESFINNKETRLTAEIYEMKLKIRDTQGLPTQEIYQNTLREKNAVMDELEKVKFCMVENEAKLNMILSSLEKIEAIVQSTEISNVISSDDIQKMDEQMSVFADSIRNVSNRELLK